MSSFVKRDGRCDSLTTVFPAAVVQALLSFADAPVESTEAKAWISRLEAARHYLDMKR